MNDFDEFKPYSLIGVGLISIPGWEYALYNPFEVEQVSALL